jgi:hypothetical protein
MKEFLFKFTDFGTTSEYESFIATTQAEAEQQANAYAKALELSYEFLGVEE